MSASELLAAPPAGWDEPSLPAEPAQGYWSSAFAKLRRDRSAIVCALVLLAIVLACMAAPLYARYVLRGNPFESNVSGTTMVGGKEVAVLQQATNGLGLGLTPIGPQWRFGPYMLGADGQGRDVAARLLYGGQNSLLIGGVATIICLTLAALTGLVAGFAGGIIDRVISIFLDVLWAFPIYLLAISLSIVLINESLHIGPITIGGNSLAVPMIIIGLVYVPYVARPVRGQVLSLRHSEFILAAEGIGASPARILWREIFPNVFSTLVVFAPLMMALNILTEAALSFLSIGVQPPAASWGTIIHDGDGLIYTRPWVAIAPGIAIVITVLALNILGDSLRDALDPRAKMRLH
ncbi:MAG: ABC transporter permease [Acetobacteraceae bacterium]